MRKNFRVSYEMAERIAQDFNPLNERYLRSLVANATCDGEYSDNLSYGELKREAYRIRSVALGILERRREVGALEKVSD
jgi:hypothetical protein